MDIVTVYPRAGTSYPDAAGVPITSTGAIVFQSKYIRDALDAHFLLTWDPYDVYQPDDRTGGGGGGGSGSTLGSVTTWAALQARIGASDGDMCELLGYYSNNDGGGGLFRWWLGDSTADDGGIVAGASPTGRWKRVLENPRYSSARWFGARGNGTADDTAALQAFLRSQGQVAGVDLHIPAGDYIVTSTLRTRFSSVDGSWSNYTIRGDGGGNYTFPATRLIWAGASTGTTVVGASTTNYAEYDPTVNGSILFQAASPDLLIEGITFTVKAGFHCGVGVNFGYEVGQDVYFITHQTMKFCQIVGNGPDLADGTMDYGVVFDYHKRATGNIENCVFESCSFGGHIHASIWTRHNTQPYNIAVRECAFANASMHSTPNFPYGVGIKWSSPSGSLTTSSTDFQRVAVHHHFNAYPNGCVIENCVSEQFKKIIYGSTGNNQQLTPICLVGGRYSTGGGIDCSSEGDLVFPIGDSEGITIGGSCALHMSGVQFNDGYGKYTWTIGVYGNDIVSSGCEYPNNTPFKRHGSYYAEKTGKVFSSGDSAPKGTGGDAYRISMPTLTGSPHPPGSVTISDAATSASVTYTTPDPLSLDGSEPVDTVELSVTTITGTPTSLSPYITAKSRTGFTVNLPTAPGVGNSVTIAYKVSR